MKNYKIVIILVLFTLVITTACGTGGTQGSNGSKPKPEITVEGKYDPPINLVSVKAVDATVKFLEGEDIHNNIWTRTYAEKLGINLSYMWVVDNSQYKQKLTATIMSGDIPDAFVVDPLLFKLLYDSDLIEDISSVYETYASENTKMILEQDPTALPCTIVDGKLMGLPMTDASIAGAPVLWIRQDWMRALGIDAPKTMQDVIEISSRFVKEDPDKNGVDDTFGIAVSKELWGAYGGLQGFFNGFHAYPRIWYEKDGSLVYGSVQPEMKQALAVLQEMYSRGEIDKEFGVKDSNKIAEAIANSKIGIEFGVWWNPYSPLNLSQANYPDAYWQAYPIPSIDDKPAKSQYSAAVFNIIAIRKGYEHPEAVLKMLNFWCDNFLAAEDEEMRDTYLGSLDNPDVVKYKYTDFHLWEPNAMLRAYKNISRALAERNPAGLNMDETKRYQVIMAYFDQGIKEAWVEVATYGENGSVSILDKIAKDGGMLNQFYGAPTKTMAEKMAALNTMEDEMITNVIMGESLDSFDAFVEKWYSMGGEDITREVNDWWKR
ncbi:MAG TPA: extracellular solute-binding protein [Clostridiales bacterium]|nr:extracellular solute-binding protein [Clostridiales bacterium]